MGDALIILAGAPALADPGEGALHQPAPRYQDVTLTALDLLARIRADVAAALSCCLYTL